MTTYSHVRNDRDHNIIHARLHDTPRITRGRGRSWQPARLLVMVHRDRHDHWHAESLGLYSRTRAFNVSYDDPADAPRWLAPIVAALVEQWGRP